MKRMKIDDNILNGVHGYTDEAHYIQPEEPVRSRLEWFQDQKFGLMMHFGPYAQLGITESWGLSDHDAPWSRNGIDWAADGEEFRKLYFGLNKSFNPVAMQPEKWAQIAADSGFRYLIFTTKHHDGFCLWDTQQTDYKTTAPDCPFHSNPNADIVKQVFHAFRKQGLGIAAYFSKPDWHSRYYWTPGMEHSKETWRFPSYDVYEYPWLWEQFVQFTHRQMLELIGGYGKVDILWLDGGQVNPITGLDIRLREIVPKLREIQPELIVADRTVGGPYENYVTPEMTIPDKPMHIPWESCLTMGQSFAYRYDDTYKTAEEIVHLLIEIICKGGNLALNIAPEPSGRLPRPAVEQLQPLGRWMKRYGEAVYGTRICAPYKTEQAAFVQKNRTIYTFVMAKGGAFPEAAILPCAGIQSVTAVHGGGAVPFETAGDGIQIRREHLPLDSEIPSVCVLKLKRV